MVPGAEESHSSEEDEPTEKTSGGKKSICSSMAEEPESISGRKASP